jgi:CheY-like chemotaxis protein
VNILVVDDNRTNRMLAELMLEGRGWNLDEARNGDEALAAIRAKIFDVILLDISMPGMSGDEVCREIKRTPGGPRVVAFTAHVMPDEIESIMAAGFDGLVTKPFTQDQLLNSLWGE